MSDTRESAVRNETTSRAINEQIEDAQAQDDDHRYLRVMCECGDAGCEQMLAVTHEEYEAVRADPRRFFVRHDHVRYDVEDVVQETDRYVVVAKKEGVPAAIAESEDPRT